MKSITIYTNIIHKYTDLNYLNIWYLSLNRPGEKIELQEINNKNFSLSDFEIRNLSHFCQNISFINRIKFYSTALILKINVSHKYFHNNKSFIRIKRR